MKWPQEPRVPGLTVIFSVDRHLWVCCVPGCGRGSDASQPGVAICWECLGACHAALTGGRAGRAWAGLSAGEGARRLQQVRGLSRRMAWHLCCPIPGSPPGMGKGGMSALTQWSRPWSPREPAAKQNPERSTAEPRQARCCRNILGDCSGRPGQGHLGIKLPGPGMTGVHALPAVPVPRVPLRCVRHQGAGLSRRHAPHSACGGLVWPLCCGEGGTRLTKSELGSGLGSLLPCLTLSLPGAWGPLFCPGRKGTGHVTPAHCLAEGLGLPGRRGRLHDRRARGARVLGGAPK